QRGACCRLDRMTRKSGFHFSWVMLYAPPMPRYRLTIEYDGTPFSGWQWQDHAPSVQRVLVDALVAFCGHEVKVTGAGRTDAGVHALGQVAHVDLEKDWRVDKVRDALNAHLRPH